MIADKYLLSLMIPFLKIYILFLKKCIIKNIDVLHFGKK